MSIIESGETVPPMEKAYHEMMAADPKRSIGYPYNFMQTLHRVASLEDGFAPADVEAAEAAWHSHGDDDILWEGGYVLRLRDGRRVYVESCSGQGDWADDATVSVEVLGHGQRYPELAASHYQTLFGWEDAPKELAEFLERLAG